MTHPSLTLAAILPLLASASILAAAEIRMIERPDDPHGSPRPARDARHVPVDTSFFFKLAVTGLEHNQDDAVAPDSLRVRLLADGREPITLVGDDGRLAENVAGWFRERDVRGSPGLVVYLDPQPSLKPGTRYTVHVAARSHHGLEFGPGDPFYLPSRMSFHAIAGPDRFQPAGPDRWSFTTANSTADRPVSFTVDFSAEPVRWQGAFFSGVCNVVFCTQEELFGPTYELMHEATKRHPHAWSFQREFWLTGTEHRPSILFSNNQPNIVRELETRRIVAIEAHDQGHLLRLEDVFGHEQYGIESNRPLSHDFIPGHKILVADGVHDAAGEVLAVNDAAAAVLVGGLETPEGGWRIDYTGPLPTTEDPDMPGLFPPGGCYLYRLDPVGTPVYFWERVNKEWDLVHGRYGRRVMPNFVDAPAFISRTGRTGYPPKDYAQWHEIVQTLTGHLIDRYGEASLDFVWSIFNEPDLNPFWRTHTDELLRFYDYTADAILRAFEDRGYDSNEVFIGGLELGGIFGTNLMLGDFLAHCSPRLFEDDALNTLNAAFADPRLDGRRSRRVERLCQPNDGRGSPLDFVSIHLYNRSDMAAAKLFRAKEQALELDPDYYHDLWVSSHEACPEWAPPPDPAAADAYRGNGYFKTWTVDLVARQLRQAAADPRYGYGETLMTVWPPLDNLQGLNAVTRRLSVDLAGDGRVDDRITIPTPIFHVLTLLSDLRDRFHILPERTIAGHSISGFASAGENKVARLVLYAHQPSDTQSRSEAEFDVHLDLRHLQASGDVRVTEYRFDRKHNSYFEPASELLKEMAAGEHAARARRVLEQLKDNGEAEREAALNVFEEIAAETGLALYGMVAEFVRRAGDAELRRHAEALLRADLGLAGQIGAISQEQAERFRELSALRPTSTTVHRRRGDSNDNDNGDGNDNGIGNKPLELTIRVKSNGINFLVVEPFEETTAQRLERQLGEVDRQIRDYLDQEDYHGAFTLAEGIGPLGNVD